MPLPFLNSYNVRYPLLCPSIKSVHLHLTLSFPPVKIMKMFFFPINSFLLSPMSGSVIDSGRFAPLLMGLRCHCFPLAYPSLRTSDAHHSVLYLFLSVPVLKHFFFPFFFLDFQYKLDIIHSSFSWFPFPFWYSSLGISLSYVNNLGKKPGDALPSFPFPLSGYIDSHSGWSSPF